ncbi:MAG: hypothetical protein AB7G17_09740 [Phycisphaerales bacterium]
MATLLVMISVAAATVLAVSYASSRQGAAAVGQNAASTSAAEAAARAGAQIAQALLETDKGWQSDANPDVLYTEFGLNNAKVFIYATTVQGGSPGANEQDVLITSRANVNGFDAVVQRMVRYQASRSPGAAIDPCMDEFAIFAVDELTVEDTCTVALWPLAPARRAGKAVKVGLGFIYSTKLNIGGAATIPGMAIYAPPGASSFLQSAIASSRFAPGDVLPITPKALAATMPSSINSLLLPGTGLTIDGWATSRSQGRYGDYLVKNRGELTLGTSGATTYYSFNDLEIESEGVLIIRGDVRIGVRDDFRVQSRGAVELASGAKLVVYVADDLTVDDAAVGFDRTVARNTSRSAASVIGYSQPSDITIMALTPSSGGTTNKPHSIDKRALVRANIHVPYDKPTIDNNSVLYGRISGKEVTIKRGSMLLYDPALDRNMGYTTRNGPLYASNGDPVTNLSLALSVTGDLQGCEVLPIVVGGLCPSRSATPVSSGTTARAGNRARGNEWPFVALSLEKNTLSASRSGLFVAPTSDSALVTFVTKMDAQAADAAP